MILDTNALSGLAEGHSSLNEILAQAEQISIPVIVLGEYKYGIRQSRYRLRYERWLSEFLENFQVVAVDSVTVEYYVDVRSELKLQGNPIPGNDMWIAALVRQHALPLISRDRHFDFVSGLKRVSW